MSAIQEPLSLFMGWKAGNWIARQRGKAKKPEQRYKLGSLACTTQKFPDKYSHTSTWVDKVWNISSIYARWIWSDGTNIYYSYGDYDGAKDYVLNGDTWEEITWNINVDGDSVWTDGTNIYHSYGTKQHVLRNGSWVAKTWKGLTDFYGDKVWTDGTNIYYSYDGIQYVLNGDTWVDKAWNVDDAIHPWSDGVNIYAYKAGFGVSGHYVLNGDTWEEKTWNIDIEYVNKIWTDGTNIYHSYDGNHHVLNGDTWVAKSWNGCDIGKYGTFWSDGTHIYLSSTSYDQTLEGYPNYVLK